MTVVFHTARALSDVPFGATVYAGVTQPFGGGVPHDVVVDVLTERVLENAPIYDYDSAYWLAKEIADGPALPSVEGGHLHLLYIFNRGGLSP